MIPIFILTCDRLKVLKASIQSYYDCIKASFEIIIIDFGSTYEPTREFLRHLEYEGKKVYWEKRIIVHSEIRRIDGIIQDYLKDRPGSKYVITDPDIVLDNVEGDVLEVYSHLLESIPRISVVGPALGTDDIPDCYPKKEEVIKWEKQFQIGEVNTIQYGNKAIRYIFAPIDTTFGMYRAGGIWKGTKKGIRVLPPYSAKHLDWYLDPKNLTLDQKHYLEHGSRRVGNWSFWGEK